ncbi:FecR family protein [Flavihumibacter sp. UBA7668]|uniref:FecR family protein n=1 Tax=Flavihumibacter sp. UBA7668 TaxID=1946542 RepID=UPI0025C5A111|nr:FecR domain-containing protein [Flavihumibacter sp. UBA7668]
MSSQELIQLLERYAAKTTSEEEEDRLVELFSNEEYKEIILDFLEKHWTMDSGSKLFPELLSKEKADQLFSLVAVSVHELANKKTIWKNWGRWMAAASIFLLLGGGFYLFNKKDLSVANPGLTRVKDDVAPPSRSLAMLATDDAQTLEVETIQKSTPAIGLKVLEINGKKVVEYEKISGTVPESKVSTHELINPRGSKQLILFLSDATKVVLNAGSRIKYPSYFSGTHRRVELEGEAYFEVAKDKTKPFEVRTKNGLIEVLGTHFNVDTDERENEMAVTLLEGSVEIVKGLERNILQPGQKAIVANSIDVINQADTAQAIAWTNDIFNFKGMELKDILHQVGEWYDVELDELQALPNLKLSGIISRDLPVSKILELISISSGLQFNIQGKKIKQVS